ALLPGRNDQLDDARRGRFEVAGVLAQDGLDVVPGEDGGRRLDDIGNRAVGGVVPGLRDDGIARDVGWEGGEQLRKARGSDTVDRSDGVLAGSVANGVAVGGGGTPEDGEKGAVAAAGVKITQVEGVLFGLARVFSAEHAFAHLHLDGDNNAVGEQDGVDA